jgi:hypothetical protein
MLTPERIAAGEQLTGDILEAIAPLVHNKPCDLVVEALAGAMLAAVTLATPSELDRRAILRRYAARLQALEREIRR